MNSTFQLTAMLRPNLRFIWAADNEFTARELHEVLGCHPTYPANFARRRGFKLRPYKKLPPLPKTGTGKQQQFFPDAKHTMQSLATELGVSVQSARYHALRHGIRLRRQYVKHHKRDEYRDVVVAGVEAKKTLEQIGAELGVTRERARQLIKELGMKKENSTVVAPKLAEAKLVLADHYWLIFDNVEAALVFLKENGIDICHMTANRYAQELGIITKVSISEGIANECCRRCYKCRQIKPLTHEHWYYHAGMPDGFALNCAVCVKAATRRYYKHTTTRIMIPGFERGAIAGGLAHRVYEASAGLDSFNLHDIYARFAAPKPSEKKFQEAFWGLAKKMFVLVEQGSHRWAPSRYRRR